MSDISVAQLGGVTDLTLEQTTDVYRGAKIITGTDDTLTTIPLIKDSAIITLYYFYTDKSKVTSGIKTASVLIWKDEMSAPKRAAHDTIGTESTEPYFSLSSTRVATPAFSNMKYENRMFTFSSSSYFPNGACIIGYTISYFD